MFVGDLMFVLYCEKHSAEKSDYPMDREGVGKRLVELMTQAVEEREPCPDCRILSTIAF